MKNLVWEVFDSPEGQIRVVADNRNSKSQHSPWELIITYEGQKRAGHYVTLSELKSWNPGDSRLESL